MRVSYQRELEYTSISTRNILDYTLIGESDDFVFLLHPDKTLGFVFDRNVLTPTDRYQQHIPIARILNTEDSQITIRDTHRDKNISQLWQQFYNTQTK
jgi:hypothetical protein